MDGLVLVTFYGSIVFCLAACAIKLYLYARFPVHLRWEIYRGSSVYETGNWWEKKSTGTAAKLGDILKNIAWLKDYYKKNRVFWFTLYPFHLGIYLLILWHIWLFVYPFFSWEGWPADYSLMWGHTATGLIITGATGILALRLFDRTLRASYPRRHYCKWVMILLAAGTGYAAVEYYFNGVMADVLSYVRGQLEFNMAEKLNPPLLTSLHVLSVSAVLIFLPFSHALRLFFRYYHELRWNNVTALRNAGIRKKLKVALNNPVTWVAKHAAARQWKDLT